MTVVNSNPEQKPASALDESSPRPRVAVLGAGLMGRGMMASLARSGYPLRIWNRTRQTAEEVAPPGALVADTPAAAVRGVDVVVLMLADPAAVTAVFQGPQGLLVTIAEGAVVLDASTVDPGTSRSCAAWLADKGAAFVDCPVYGSKNEAAQGQLGFLVGAAPEVLERVRPVLSSMGRAIHHLGPVGAGTTGKLVLNSVIATTLAAAQEGLVFAAKAGLDPRAMFDVLMTSRTRSGILEMKGERMLNGDFEAFFALRLMNKDLQLALQAAHAAAVPTPLLSSLKQTFSAAMAAGLADRDFSVAIQAMARAAGTELGGSREAKGPSDT